ncbi:MAG: ribonuclease III [Coriobacteriales bacterium]|nr:ribonuclease III [Coriobacteriales bacterium]
MKLHARVRAIEEIVGYTFTQEHVVVSAITHPSAAEGRAVSASYERLEFLGDSILGAIVASYVYGRFPSMNEGELSRIKTVLVEGKTLSRIGNELGIGPLILMGESEKGTGARGMTKALEDVYEALVGALYVDGGWDPAEAFVRKTLFPHVTASLAEKPLSPKSRLQEVTQRDYHEGPVYKLVSTTGPAHTPTFTSVVLVGGCRVGRGSGSTKKESQAEAALNALVNLGYVGEARRGSSLQEVEEAIDVP